MEAECAGVEACTVSVGTRQVVRLSGDRTLAGNIAVRFEAGGEWAVEGGALTIGSGRVEAPERQQVFAAGSQVRGLDEARPEWFAGVGVNGYPAEALAGAYRATKAWGTIRMGVGAYLSPFFDPTTWNTCGSGKFLLYDSPRTFVGAGRPGVDEERDPQRLVGGTIVRGEVCGVAALKVYHLGLDEGPWVVRNLYGGNPAYGFMLTHAGPVGLVRGTHFEDVSVLTNGMENQHSLIVEGQDDVTVQGLWIWTQGGTHGLVIKSSHATVRDFHCKGASSECLIVKSDAATDGAGYAADVVVDGVEISALKRDGDTGGIEIDSRWDAVERLRLEHVTERGTTYGIKGSGSWFHSLRDLTIRDWTAEVMGECLHLERAEGVIVEGFRCATRGDWGLRDAMWIDAGDVRVRSGRIECAGTCEAVSGIADLGRGNRFEDVTGVGLGGYLLETGGRAGMSGLGGVDGRVVRRYVAPRESLAVKKMLWVEEMKVNLRIAVTALDMRMRARAEFALGVIGLVVVGGAGLVWAGLAGVGMMMGLRGRRGSGASVGVGPPSRG
jgi:hypothetical protein